jgi:hypothetical protein
MDEHYTRTGLYTWEADAASVMVTVDWSNTLSNKWITWRLNPATGEFWKVGGNHAKTLPKVVIKKASA